jgi:hypothetical protein
MSLEIGQLVFVKDTGEGARLEEYLSDFLVRVYLYGSEKDILVDIANLEDSFEEPIEHAYSEEQSIGKLRVEGVTLSVTIPEETSNYTGFYVINGDNYKINVSKVPKLCSK